MKIILLAVFVAVVAASQMGGDMEGAGPWQSGRHYTYEVVSHTLAHMSEGAGSGGAVRARLHVRVRAPGVLRVRLEQVEHASHRDAELPADLPYKPVANLDLPVNVAVAGGHVLSLDVPKTFPLAGENLLKGLLSALQVDLSYKGYNFAAHQGQFTAQETDVTGECETLYAVSPLGAAWSEQLPRLPAGAAPLEITKSRNYGKCARRVAYHFGVPTGAAWSGAVSDSQFVKRATESRIIADTQGTIYQAETTGAVFASPLLYGKQKAEVYSRVKLTLASVEPDSAPEWTMPKDTRHVASLIYSLTSESASIDGSSDESNESKNYAPVIERARRSPKYPKDISNSNKVASEKQNKYSSGSSESYESHVNAALPGADEPAPAAHYMQGDAAAPAPLAAQKLAQEIAQQLQNANAMPKADTLSKFNILVRVVAAMSTEQLSKTSRGIEAAKLSGNAVKADTWMVFRDAVAQAGTTPAFRQISTWIRTGRLQGEEAAQVFASLATSLRYPTKQLMSEMFELAMSTDVMKQPFLNSSAVLAATRFINMGYVDAQTAQARYPTHMYGSFARNDESFVTADILPRLATAMQSAVQNGDSAAAQLYIRAIGNLGDAAILDLFAPYLEGKIVVSTFLRQSIIQSLGALASRHDHGVRAALYSVLRNSAESYEVRVAAVQTIFMSRPTPAMMQAMAQMTHDDPSVHVRATIKSAIQTAAQLKEPRHAKLATIAKASVEMLTKEEFGVQYSAKRYMDFYDEEMDAGIFSALNYIGSENSLLPKYFKFAWKNKIQSRNNEDTISASFSDVHQFIEYFKEQLPWKNQKEQEKEPIQKYSAEKIAQMMNFQQNPANPLEAAISMNLMSQQRFFAFSENDMKQIPYFIQKSISELAKGVDFHYTKILNQARMTIMFPLPTGMPFIFKYKEPTLIHLQGKAKAHIQFPSKENADLSASLDKEIQITYARNIDGSVGFLDTLSGQHASVGVVNKLQVNLPFKAQAQAQAGQLRVYLEPLRPAQDTTVAHYSVWPYSASQDQDSLTTVSQDPATEVIRRQEKVSSLDYKFGQVATGAQFHLEGYSYSNDHRSLATLFHGKDVLSMIAFIGYQKDIALTHYNFKHLGKQSQNKGITITAVYGKYFNKEQKPAANNLKAMEIKDISPNSSGRRQEMMQRVAAGIKEADMQVIDLSATFEGAQKGDYVVTVAAADSAVDSTTNYAFFAAKNSARGGSAQISGVGSVVRPRTIPFNVVEAIKGELKTAFNADIVYGPTEHAKMRIDGYLERTKKAVREIEQLPMYKQAVEDIAQNNYYQRAAHDIIMMAQSPDYLKASVEYGELSPAFKNMTHQLYSLSRHYTYWYTDENILKIAPEGKVELEVQASYAQRWLDAHLRTRAGELRLRRAPLPRTPLAAAPAASLANYYTADQYLPYCTVDGSKIKTFSQRSYEYTLGDAWHVVAYDAGTHAHAHAHSHAHEQEHAQFVVLARKPEQGRQEIYISYRTKSGKAIEIEMKPAAAGAAAKAVVSVSSSLQKTSSEQLTTYWEGEQPVLRYYPLPGGAVMIQLEDMAAMFDGERVIVFAESRNRTRGVCGRMSGDASDDRTPGEYGAAFKLGAQAQVRPVKNLVYTNILRGGRGNWRSEKAAGAIRA